VVQVSVVTTGDQYVSGRILAVAQLRCQRRGALDFDGQGNKPTPSKGAPNKITARLSKGNAEDK